MSKMDSPGTLNLNSLQTFRRHIITKYAINIPEFKKILIWTIGISIAIGLTVKDLMPLLNEYRHNNVATQIRVILMDEDFNPPRVMVNLPPQMFRKVGANDDLRMLAHHFYSGNVKCDKTGCGECKVCKQLVDASWDVWNDQNLTRFPNNQSEESLLNALSLALFQKLMHNVSFEGHSALDDEYSTWNGPIVSSAMNYFEWLGEMDFGLGTHTPGLKVHPGLDYLHNIEDKDKRLDLLHNRLMELLCTRVNFSEWDVITEFTDPVPTGKAGADLLEEMKVPFQIDRAGFLFSLPHLEKPIMKEYRFVFSQNNSIQADPVTPHPIFLYSGGGITYLSVIDGPFLSYLYQAPIESRRTSQVVTAKYKVLMRARETRKQASNCQNLTSVTVCFPQCTKMWVIEQCKCIPFNIRRGLQYPEHFPFCDARAYAQCNISALPPEIKDKCMEECKSSCEFTSYSWQFGYDAEEPMSPNTTELILKIFPLFGSFNEFSWTTKTSPEQFVSQLGGIGNFYLGTSGLSMFAVIVACVDWWNKYKKMKQKESDSLKNGHSGEMRVTNFESNFDYRRASVGFMVQEEWFQKLKQTLMVEITKDLVASVNSRKTVGRDNWFMELKEKMKAEIESDLLRRLK